MDTDSLEYWQMYFGVAGLGKDTVSLSLSLSLNTHTHTHTHTHTVGERENVKFLTIVRKCVEIFFYENKDDGSVNANWRYKTDIHHEH